MDPFTCTLSPFAATFCDHSVESECQTCPLGALVRAGASTATAGTVSLPLHSLYTSLHTKTFIIGAAKLDSLLYTVNNLGI